MNMNAVMPWYKLAFLVFVMVASSGYRFRCYWLCTDQTAIQNDYVEERDRCRGYAEAKVDLSLKEIGKTGDEKARNGQLVALFSQCMANHGWTVPDGKDGKGLSGGATAAVDPKAAAGIAAGAGPIAASATDARQQDKAFLMRQAECDFARADAPYNKISAARAEACDMECNQRLKNAPDAPRPGACPSSFKPTLGKGVYRGE